MRAPWQSIRTVFLHPRLHITTADKLLLPTANLEKHRKGD